MTQLKNKNRGVNLGFLLAKEVFLNFRLRMNGVLFEFAVLMQFIIERLDRDTESIRGLRLVAVEIIQGLQNITLFEFIKSDRCIVVICCDFLLGIQNVLRQVTGMIV